MPLAPTAEQERINDKVDELTSVLDAGIAGVARVEANLVAYKASLLKAGVEGKLTANWREEHPDAEPGLALLEPVLAEQRACRDAEPAADYGGKAKTPPQAWSAKYEEPEDQSAEGLRPLPRGWSWTNLGQVKLFSMYGPRFSSDNYSSEGKLVLRTTDFDGRGGVNLHTPPRLDLPVEVFEKYRLQPGDLLITRTGSIGSLAIFPGGADAIAGAFLIYYRLRASLTTIRYIHYFLASPSGQRSLITGAAGVGRPNLNAPTIERIPIPFPPLSEQKQVVSLLDYATDAVWQRLSEVQVVEVRAKRLRDAILARAFSGTLVP